MKIGLVGSVSVGKTTLINELSKLPQFKDYKIATERSKYLRDLGIPLNTDSTLKGQIIFTAERASELFHENLLTDRTVIDVMAFTNLAKSMTPSEKYKLEMLGNDLVAEYDYIFYIPIDGVDIEDNGVRTINPIYRKEIDIEIQKLLLNHSNNLKNINTLFGSTEERIKKLLEIVKL
jgi:GTPase SAR1 family protein